MMEQSGVNVKLRFTFLGSLLAVGLADWRPQREGASHFKMALINHID